MLRIILILFMLIVLAGCGGNDADQGSAANSQPAQAESSLSSPDALKLYVLDCGTIEISDIGIFSMEGDYDGQADTYTDTCFLIRHPKGDMLWDLGLPTSLVGEPPQENGAFTVSLDTTISNQLIEIGLGPEEVEYFAISHQHFDHVGQIDQVRDSTWLVHEAEYNSMFPPQEDTEPEDVQDSGSDEEGTDVGLSNPFAGFADVRRELFTGEKDVFGDGSVIIFPTPGHTPGHTSLQVNLPKSGTVLLTGDLYHRSESRKLSRIPSFNASFDMTRDSMKAFEARAERLNAKVIIQHEPNDIDPLPKAPKAME